jgi:hypothetical protein
LSRGTTFLIRPSLDLKWIFSYNPGKLLGVEFNWYLIKNFWNLKI